MSLPLDSIKSPNMESSNMESFNMESFNMESLRGDFRYDVPLGSNLWFGCGGSAEILYKPANVADLQAFLKAKPVGLAHMVIGAGSNVIIRDGGIRGIVIRLRKAFGEICITDDIVVCGAGAADINVAKVTAEAGLSGLEFFAGIPGTVGGAVKMNAGAHGGQVQDYLLDCDVVDARGNLISLSNADLGYAYRSSALADDDIVVSARFQLERRPQAEIAANLAKVRDLRQSAQPLRGKTCGSIFKNPVGDGLARAWELISAAGCRDWRVGGAYLSPQHCNFMFNDRSARAEDLEALGERVRMEVFNKTGVCLEWEIQRIGEHGEQTR